MSASALTLALITKALTPLIKDIYNEAKGEVKKSLSKWNATNFPKKLASKIKQIDTVRTIWSPEENVSLRKFYYPCKIISRSGINLNTEKISDLGNDCIIIQGIVGQGKSIFMRYLALQEITSEENKRIPLFMELRKVSKSTSLPSLIKKTLSNYDIELDESTFNYLLSSGKIVLLLDGFDELDESMVIETTNDLENLTTKHPDLQIIVSSRPANEIQKLNCFRILEIAPLDTNDYTPFLKSLDLKTSRISHIVNAIEASPSQISQLISTPLMLTLVIFVYQSERQIPAELPEFFERLFYTVFTRHDKLKAAFERQHYSGLPERKLQNLFEAFCFMSIQLGSARTLSRSTFSEAFDLAQTYIEGANCSESSFKKDITKVACLMLEEGLGDVTFLHKSIAEYHAAAFIKSSDDSFAERFYDMAAVEWNTWAECLNFLKSIDIYRFSKYFAIQEIKKAIPTFEKLYNCNTAKEIQQTLPEWIKELYITLDLEFEDSDVYTCTSVGAWSKSPNIFESELSTLVSHISIDITGNVTINKITEMRDSGIHILAKTSSAIRINFADAVMEWGINAFKFSMLNQVETLNSMLAEAVRISEKLERRQLIFDKKQ